jgi:hypothetical protein
MGEVLQMKDPKKKVDVLDRIILLGILPKEGSFANLKLLRVVKENLSFNESENRALQFRQEATENGTMMVWNTIKLKNKASGEIIRAPNNVLQAMAEKDPDLFEVEPACPAKAIFFGEVIEGLIKKALLELDKAEKLTAEHYSVYEKFVGDEGE